MDQLEAATQEARRAVAELDNSNFELGLQIEGMASELADYAGIFQDAAARGDAWEMIGHTRAYQSLFLCLFRTRCALHRGLVSAMSCRQGMGARLDEGQILAARSSLEGLLTSYKEAALDCFEWENRQRVIFDEAREALLDAELRMPVANEGELKS